LNNAVYVYGGNKAYQCIPLYKEAERVQYRAEAKYGKSKVSTVGHSQGGLQAELLGKDSNEIITLNKAT
jgi:malonyl CoA-acyl carrier protein transacylase